MVCLRSQGWAFDLATSHQIDLSSSTRQACLQSDFFFSMLRPTETTARFYAKSGIVSQGLATEAAGQVKYQHDSKESDAG